MADDEKARIESESDVSAHVVGAGAASDEVAPAAEAKEKEAHPHLATEAIYHAYVQQFLSTDLVDRGKSLQSRSRLDGGMKIRLSPIESRHETVMRPMATMIASLVNRVRHLEEKLGIDWQAIQDASTSGQSEDQAAEAGSGAGREAGSGEVGSASGEE